MEHRPPDRAAAAQGPEPIDETRFWPRSQLQSQSRAHELVSSSSPAAAVSAVRDTAAITSAPLPSSNSEATPAPSGESANMVMDVDSSADMDDRARRATSVLSMDDIEAAQALEGLRSGKQCVARSY
jgi:hypothetical protein